MALTKTDLESMGIGLLGDQYAVMDELTELKRAARRVLRDQILWRVRSLLKRPCLTALLGPDDLWGIVPVRLTGSSAFVLTQGKEKLFDNCLAECLETCCYVCPM